MNSIFQKRITYREFKIACCTRIKLHFYLFCKYCLTDREKKLNKIMKKAEGKLKDALNMQILIKN